MSGDEDPFQRSLSPPPGYEAVGSGPPVAPRTSHSLPPFNPTGPPLSFHPLSPRGGEPARGRHDDTLRHLGPRHAYSRSRHSQAGSSRSSPALPETIVDEDNDDDDDDYRPIDYGDPGRLGNGGPPAATAGGFDFGAEIPHGLGRQGIDGEDPPLAGNPYAAGLGDQPADTTPLNPRIVLGLDYGTTYSGLSTLNVRVERAPVIGDVRMFQAGGDGPGADHKVPSRYSYTPALHHAQWGSDIADNSDVLQWTKLTLDPQTVLAHLKQLRDLATFLHSKSDLFNEAVPVWQRNEHKNIRKSPTDVVGDYIHKLIEFWAEKVERDRAYVLDENHIDVVVTHPAKWSYAAQNKTIQAVQTGFHKAGVTIRNMYTCSEPEAAALFTAYNEAPRNLPRVGNALVMCDAGGGTVDLITFIVRCQRPLLIEPIGESTSATCGATFVDREFNKYLKTIFEDWEQNELGNGGNNVANRIEVGLLYEFEPIKRAFGSNALTSFAFSAAGLTRLDTDYAAQKVRQGTLDITRADLVLMFRRSVEKTIELIQHQVGMAETEKTHVTHIFMGGGFSQNQHFVSQVQTWAQARHIRVKRADDCMNAVAKGAAMKGAGIGASMPQPIQRLRRAYGFVATGYDIDSKGKKVETTGQIDWVLKSGDIIPPVGRAEFKRAVEATCSTTSVRTKKIDITFVTSTRSDSGHLLPSTTKELGNQDRIETITLPFSGIPDEDLDKKGFNVSARLRMFIGLSSENVILSVWSKSGSRDRRVLNLYG